MIKPDAGTNYDWRQPACRAVRDSYPARDT